MKTKRKEKPTVQIKGRLLCIGWSSLSFHLIHYLNACICIPWNLESGWEDCTPFMYLYYIHHLIPPCSGSKKMCCVYKTSLTMACSVLTQAAIRKLEVQMCCMTLLKAGTPATQSFMTASPARMECAFSSSSLACVESWIFSEIFNSLWEKKHILGFLDFSELKEFKRSN